MQRKINKQTKFTSTNSSASSSLLFFLLNFDGRLLVFFLFFFCCKVLFGFPFEETRDFLFAMIHSNINHLYLIIDHEAKINHSNVEKLRCYTIHFVRHLTMLKEPAFKQDSGSVTFFSYFIGQCHDNAKRVNQSQPGREGGKPKHAANLLLIVTFVSYHRRRNVTSVSVVLEELFVKPQHCTLS